MRLAKAFDLLGSYTAEQWGMVTTQQAGTFDVDLVTLHRLKEAGFLEPVRYGIYASTSAGASAARDEQAAWLSLQPGTPGWQRSELDRDGGVVSHRSAARLYGLGELVNDRVELTVPRRRVKRDPTIRIRQAKLSEVDVTVIDGLPVTTPLRTICDLLGERTDTSHVATIIRQAVEAGQVRLDYVAEQIGRYARRYEVRPADGTTLLQYLLEQIDLSITDLARRPAPSVMENLGETTWESLRDKPVTWRQLAELSPELTHRLFRTFQHTGQLT